MIQPTQDDIEWWNNQISMRVEKRQFHAKLYLALEQTQACGFDDVIAWMPHGRAFKIMDKKRFEEQVLMPFLHMKVYSSFRRQCNLYGFRRLTNASGTESSGAMYNEYFVRGRPELLTRMIRMKNKGTNVRPASCSLSEPDFFSMPQRGSIMNAVPDEHIESNAEANKARVGLTEHERSESTSDGFKHRNTVMRW
eukprot:CAMPEP_0116006694 /NCGR_PEP_ID=MMETSP0321-20121206/1876_1 /TAXON_ID=163516 /ORGANISM="Leptocylindrus danicus var. danicus, Strain B650" /LENGTH=194 /DNA_ID=CAMNT_0003475287 /DNA_START=255 /DNA_END=836 /DNA_ORIENTATION=-